MWYPWSREGWINLIFQGCPPSGKGSVPETSAGLAGSPAMHGDGKSTTGSHGGNILKHRVFDMSFWAASTAADVEKKKEQDYDLVIFHNSLPHTTLERQTAFSCWRTDVKTGAIYAFSNTTMVLYKACHNTALSDVAKFTRVGHKGF